MARRPLSRWEAQLAEIEGGKHAVLAPSGLAAITIVDFAFLKSGDDVLIPETHL